VRPRRYCCNFRRLQFGLPLLRFGLPLLRFGLLASGTGRSTGVDAGGWASAFNDATP